MKRLFALALLLWPLFSACSLAAQTVDVSLSVNWTEGPGLHERTPIPHRAVVWLTPLAPGSAGVSPGRFRITQKDKAFHPHLLVVPVGSVVQFPNLDPFFHNVFSLFNGKRFDLGLYEAGSSRDVHFDHEGASYLFCNIHPEMSAVVLTLATPYSAIAQADGTLTLPAVPSGSYRLNVWAEGLDAGELAKLGRVVEIGASHSKLGTLTIPARKPVPHKNKFGEDYKPEPRLY